MATSFLSLRRQWPVYLDDYIFGIRFLTSLVTATSFLCGSRCSKKYGFSILIPVPERFEDYILRWLPLHRLCDSRGVHSRHLLLWNPMTTITAEESLTHVAVALIAEEFFTDEAEELEIGFLSKFLLFIYVGFTYWSIPPCVLQGVHRWLPLHRPCALRGVLSSFATTTSSLCLSRSTFSASIYWSTCVLQGVHCRYPLLRTAEELHTGEVKSLLPSLSHLRCIYLLEYLGALRSALSVSSSPYR